MIPIEWRINDATIELFRKGFDLFFPIEGGELVEFSVEQEVWNEREIS